MNSVGDLIETDSDSALGAERPAKWDYHSAFARHQGLLTAGEQDKLRNSRVAIIGMGGVGGVHLTTLARLGIGAFTIADPDVFEIANFNRQVGARTSTLGRSKATVMAEDALAINPELKLKVFSEPISARNAEAFLDGADILVDGVDFFCLDARRLVFQEARRRGLWAVTAAPLGFSSAWLSFSPVGMAFDDYFDLNDSQSTLEQLVAFAVGLAPQMTQRSYLDLKNVRLASKQGPSSGLACQLCSGITAAEVLAILLGRGGQRPAPAYFQFDAYRRVFKSGRLTWGNRHPLQRLKRWWLARHFSAQQNHG
jgi:molybdopterin/thiamine biosynthesis adenylyltransferase